jgi:hypothetical protein
VFDETLEWVHFSSAAHSATGHAGKGSAWGRAMAGCAAMMTAMVGSEHARDDIALLIVRRQA